MNTAIKDTLRSDFEKMMRYCLQKNGDFGFNLFGDYAVSALNFYVGSSILPPNEKREAALFLADLYNAGIRNAISPEDLQEIADVLTQDATLNYQLLAPIFD
ncbi:MULTISPECIES: hypothetical protein [unclassified Sphingobacterium]|jgi:hypothetical protein|uniref:hypothetical protein n=1 Tax=unclassified Sphingobacterium TaxID=2609468 RepID=UPI002952B934|nr:hypothetical protein [Sphingobacterium sp. UGAL515B_05]WON93371.1 hypothetical protein OK025_19230 [Sphingobacterium sp. UGAL515B_05]